jgi:hypothetical protein
VNGRGAANFKRNSTSKERKKLVEPANRHAGGSTSAGDEARPMLVLASRRERSDRAGVCRGWSTERGTGCARAGRSMGEEPSAARAGEEL